MDSNLKKALDYLSPADLDYSEWVAVGMAIKEDGGTWHDWDSWSRADSRYRDGECERKWDSFSGSGKPVTAATVVQMAKDRGLTFGGEFKAYDWDDVISFESSSEINTNEGVKLFEPSDWNPVHEVVTYLETLFEINENVGYVTEVWANEEKGTTRYMPTKGAYDRTAGELINALNNCGGDIGSVLGDCNEQAGAWIRFNPLDGKGVKNDNVTDYRYALVESDSMPLEQQNAVMRDLQLPIAIMVYSGGKSIHSIVRIDAPNYDEYRKRVDYLYKVCGDNGLIVDKNCRNPSRLSRLPGVMRKGKKQYIIDKNIGYSSFNEWKDYVESINDNLPDIENAAEFWDDMPPLAPCLIDGVLRQGHKMLIAGPSKAGKSFALIELCIAIASGTSWLGFNCTQGKVMYVNLELDDASCKHRIKDVCTAMGVSPQCMKNFDIWNLRGKSVPMDKLAPMLIRRAAKKQYIAIVIDPIYKVITGDENSADQMAHFCNQFDKVCTELKCAVIYCHHHSKGAQGGKKSMDRASGSGVFARDPDALIDLVELEISDTLRTQQDDDTTCKTCLEWLKRFNVDVDEVCSQDDQVTAKRMLEIAHTHLQDNSYKRLCEDIETRKQKLKSRTAWRIEGTLREFPTFEPLDVWFTYPTHTIDDVGVLKDCNAEDFNSKNSNFRRNFDKQRTAAERKKERAKALETAFNSCNINGKVMVQDLAGFMGVSERTVRNHINELENFDIDNNEVKMIGKEKVE